MIPRHEPWTKSAFSLSGCPVCHVPPLTWCVTRNGGKTQRLHKAREAKYKALYLNKRRA